MGHELISLKTIDISPLNEDVTSVQHETLVPGPMHHTRRFGTELADSEKDMHHLELNLQQSQHPMKHPFTAEDLVKPSTPHLLDSTKYCNDIPYAWQKLEQILLQKTSQWTLSEFEEVRPR